MYAARLRSQVDLEIRRVEGPGLPPPLVLARQQTKQSLTPDRLLADFDFQLEVLHNGVRELQFECDPSLRPYEVTINNLELKEWKSQEGADPGAPTRLVAQLREPFLGTLPPLRIRCLAPLATDKPWVCPGVRLLNALPRGDLCIPKLREAQTLLAHGDVAAAHP